MRTCAVCSDATHVQHRVMAVGSIPVADQLIYSKGSSDVIQNRITPIFTEHVIEQENAFGDSETGSLCILHYPPLPEVN